MKNDPISKKALSDMLDHPVLSHAEEACLSARIKAGDESAIHELVRHNLKLAWAYASRREAGATTKTEELFSESVLELYAAAKRYDAALGTFPQFAEFRLREAWRKHARFEGYPTASSRKWQAAVDMVVWHWLERCGRAPSHSGLVAALGWSWRKIRSARGRIRPISLNAALEAEGPQLMDTIADDAAESPAMIALQSDLRDQIRVALDALEPRTKAIIEHRYGFEALGARELPLKRRTGSLRNVGADFGLSRESIRRLETEGLTKLRKLLTDTIQSRSPQPTKLEKSLPERVRAR